MEKNGLQVSLEQVHCQQWYAQTFTYTYYLLFQSHTPQEKAKIETITGVGSKLLGLYIREEVPVALVLDADEVQVVKEMFEMLQEIYDAHRSSEQASMALEHLTTCRLLLQQAEQASHACLEIPPE